MLNNLLSNHLSGKLFAINRWHAGQDHLDQRYFLLTLFAAIFLHIAGFYAWSLMPKIDVVDVPVHVLSIKLSDSDDMTTEEIKTMQPNADNSVTVESTVSHLVRDPEEEKEENQARQQTVAATMDKAMSDLDKADVASAPVKTPTTLATPAAPASKAVVKGTFNVRSEGTNIAAPVLPVTAHQFVRTNETQALPDNSAIGKGSALDAEMISHYEQLISLWIQKFKIYPDDARKQDMQGETVVRVRIDRQGNIRYYVLEHSTGYPLLDHAAIDMIRRANPVPAVPADYPRGDLMEFLIPVSFHLEP